MVHLGKGAPAVTYSHTFCSLHLFCHFCPLVWSRGSLPAGRPPLSPSEQHWRTGGRRGSILILLLLFPSSRGRAQVPGSVSPVYPNSTYRSCCFHLLFVLLSASLSLSFNPHANPPPPHPHRWNAKPTCCCWWCTGATSWTRPAGTRVQRAVTWPRWPLCWRRWRGPTSRRPANMWWSNWCRVRRCAPKPSPWCPSECDRRGGQYLWRYSHIHTKQMGLSSTWVVMHLGEDINWL